MLRRGRLARILLALLVFSGWCATDAMAMSDNLPGFALNTEPHASAAGFDLTTPSFDSSSYTVSALEDQYPTRFLGCAGWGAKTAWLRFATAVTGTLNVTVNTGPPGHDTFYRVLTAASQAASEVEMNEIDCHNGHSGPTELYVHGHTIPGPGQVFIQVAVVCKSNPATPACDAGQIAAGPGGPTTVRVQFRPHDRDGDGVPDTLDGCPDAAGMIGGCPDSDGDGIPDHLDQCPGVSGKDHAGCDADGDGHRSTAAGGGDCDDTDPRRHPGASERPGTRIDMNCDGKLRPYPSVSNGLAGMKTLTRDGRYVGFSHFKLLDAKKGMRIQLHCKGRGCGFSVRRHRVARNKRSMIIGRYLRPMMMKPGDQLTVSLVRPRHIGKVVRYTFRKKGQPRVETLCLPAGSLGPPKRSC